MAIIRKKDLEARLEQLESLYVRLYMSVMGHNCPPHRSIVDLLYDARADIRFLMAAERGKNPHSYEKRNQKTGEQVKKSDKKQKST